MNVAVGKKNLWERIRLNAIHYVMIGPYAVGFLFFTVVPVIAALVLSFTYFNMVEFPEWRGWFNYIRLFLDDDVFLIAVKNTLVFAFITGPISYLMCLLLAWFINEMRPWLRTFLTFLFFAPSISGELYLVWGIMFNGSQYGYMNGFLLRLGLINDPIQWLTDPAYTMKVLILVQLWTSLGAAFLAFIAGLKNIDPKMYEAAAIDGIKNRWQELWHITLPAMAPQLMFGAVMQISISFAVSRICMQLAGFPSTDYSAHTVVTHIIDVGFIRYEMGYASAIATVLFIAMALTTIAIRRFLRKFN
ncbi:MAG: sugar ABC transporter permease [Phycisphaerales bacterium]|nr:sugar ABC transporter permease [Phycisphaerales bacterium]